MMRLSSKLAAVVALIGLALARSANSQPISLKQTVGDEQIVAGIDRVFAHWNDSTLPGCTVGVARDGKDTIRRAYGMADLEHGAPNLPDSIIEAGSVSKQFTAAAVLLLVQQGKVSLDDPVRKYIPELPDYGAPLTVRHILTHTSGLRDWGAIEDIVGWPRTSRAYTHAHVLDIVSRQKALNFPPGSAYSYSNTGYNLAAILVSRVSGKSFPDFTREMLFEPLGMTRTSWRDDFTRVVPGRSIAYDVSSKGVITTDMPFENVHGNGGLLTTVGDLLRWNQNAVSAKVGGSALIDLQRQPMKLNNGASIEYAFGLRVGTWKGMPEISHSGSTAGYRAWLAQYPTQGNVSVAVLCNAANANPTMLGHEVGDLFLPQSSDSKSAAPAVTPMTDGELPAIAGLYRDRRRNEVMKIALDNGSLRIVGPGALTPIGKDRFQMAAGAARLDVDRASNGTIRGVHVTSAGEVITFDRFNRTSPTIGELATYVGSYSSDEAELTLRVALENGSLVVHRRPDSVFKLTPTYADAFTGSLGGIRFIRDAKGAITEMSVSVDRVWDLRFARNSLHASR